MGITVLKAIAIALKAVLAEGGLAVFLGLPFSVWVFASLALGLEF